MPSPGSDWPLLAASCLVRETGKERKGGRVWGARRRGYMSGCPPLRRQKKTLTYISAQQLPPGGYSLEQSHFCFSCRSGPTRTPTQFISSCSSSSTDPDRSGTLEKCSLCTSTWSACCWSSVACRSLSWPRAARAPSRTRRTPSVTPT